MGFWNQVINGKVFEVNETELTHQTEMDDETIRLLAAQMIPKQLYWSKDLCKIVPAYTKGGFKVPFKDIDEYGFYNYYSEAFSIKISPEGNIALIDVFATNDARVRTPMYTVMVKGSSKR